MSNSTHSLGRETPPAFLLAPIRDALGLFESANCTIEEVGAVLGALGDEIEQDKITARGARLIYAALKLLDHAAVEMTSGIARAYEHKESR